MFSSYIIWYLFLAGVGSGSFAVASICSIRGALNPWNASEGIERRISIGFVIAPAAMILAAIFLLVDLGAPERAWRIVLMPFQSIVATGTWFLILLLIVSAILAAYELVGKEAPRFVQWFCWLTGLLLSFSVMLYSGLLLSDMVSIDFWYTWLLPLLFVVSSLSTGLASVCTLDLLLGKTGNTLKAFWMTSLLVGVIEAAVLGAFLFDRYHASEAARASCEILFFGEHAAVFWVGVCGCAFLIPFVIQGLYRWIPSSALVLVSGLSVLIGGFCLRYCIVNVALYTPISLGVFL